MTTFIGPTRKRRRTRRQRQEDRAKLHVNTMRFMLRMKAWRGSTWIQAQRRWFERELQGHVQRRPNRRSRYRKEHGRS